MPTYEYACKSCGEHTEVAQNFHDSPLTVCSSCGGELRKVFGAVGIVFKGSGFYKTDSRATSKRSKGGAAKTEGTAKTGSGSSEPASSGGGSDSGSGSAPASGNGSGSKESKPAATSA